VGYNHQANLERLWVHLHDAPPGTRGPEGTARARITLALVAEITHLRAQIKALEEQIAQQLAEHPDAAICTSLPRSGTVRAARLLAEIGDARGRFPTPEALTCLAGAAPSTRQSGKVKIVALGSTSSAAAGKTTSPTTPTSTKHYSASSTSPLDTGLLMPRSE
jgi:transposase